MLPQWILVNTDAATTRLCAAARAAYSGNNVSKTETPGSEFKNACGAFCVSDNCSAQFPAVVAPGVTAALQKSTTFGEARAFSAANRLRL